MRITLLAILVLGSAQACVSSTSTVTETEPQQAATANLNLGVAYLRQGRPDLAVESLERALAYDPRLAAAHGTIAIVYEQLDNRVAAEEHYRRATQLPPDTGVASNAYAVFLCRDGRWSEAERYFRRAADNPRYTTPEAALTNAGVCARGAGDAQTAERYFREALGRNAVFPDALYNMAELSYQAQDYLAARAFTQRYLGGATGTPEILLLCVQVERQLDASAAADQCAARLRSGFPNSAEVAQLEAMDRDDRR